MKFSKKFVGRIFIESRLFIGAGVWCILSSTRQVISTTCFEKHDEWNLNGITRFIFKSKLLWIIDYQVVLHNHLFINPDWSFSCSTELDSKLPFICSFSLTEIMIHKYHRGSSVIKQCHFRYYFWFSSIFIKYHWSTHDVDSK